MAEIQVNFILEVLGKPAENVDSAIQELIKRLNQEKNITLTSVNYHKAAPLKDAPNLFTGFVEVSADLSTLETYFGLLFNYFPANIEVVDPQELRLRNTDLNELGNGLIHRLHEYDALAKKFIGDNQILLNIIKQEAPKVYEKLTNPQPPVQKESLESELEKDKQDKKIKKQTSKKKKNN